MYKSGFFLFEPERQILGIICMRGTAYVRGCEDLSAIRRTQRLRENKNAYDHVVCLKKKDVQKTREHPGIYQRMNSIFSPSDCNRSAIN
jgi:hypothetical protein